jgi:hypothetical protein
VPSPLSWHKIHGAHAKVSVWRKLLRASYRQRVAAMATTVAVIGTMTVTGAVAGAASARPRGSICAIPACPFRGMSISETFQPQGYWLVTARGEVFSYGYTVANGSEPATHRLADTVGMASGPGGAGYWLVASDGTVDPFGDVSGYGGAATGSSPIVGIAATADGGGYWLTGKWPTSATPRQLAT